MNKLDKATSDLLNNSIEILNKNEKVRIGLIGYDIKQYEYFILDHIKNDKFFVTTVDEDEGELNISELSIIDKKRLIYKILSIVNKN